MLAIDLQLQLWNSSWSFYSVTNIEVEDEDQVWWKIWDRIPTCHKEEMESCLQDVFIRHYLGCLM